MFYFKPPRGNIQLQQLEDCVLARMTYFIKEDGKSCYETEVQNSNFEYMLSGTPMDRTGHFILRLLTYGDHLLKEFFVNSEAKLFSKRIDSFTATDLIQFLKTTIRHVEELLISSGQTDTWLNTVTVLLKYIQSCVFKSHYTSFNHNKYCSQYRVSVPFQYCLPLVKNREVHIVQGYGQIPCGKWRELIENLFCCHLYFSLKEIEAQKHLLTEINCDSRFLDLKKILHHMYYSSVMTENSEVDKGVVLASDIDDLSSYFPPCMSLLYSNLKTKHRLSHQARFYFSLYLKDIGMPVKESIQLWKLEYSKSTNCNNSNCTHSWQRDSVRYEYSIRHMYGLEGSRKNYKTPLCSKMQNSALGPTAEGGCPFLHFNEKSLSLFIDPAVRTNEELYNHIIQLKINKKPKDACFFYSKAFVLTKCSKTNWIYETVHKGPVEFYNRVRNSMLLEDCQINN